jgi:DNA-binding response OmpR family regulator
MTAEPTVLVVEDEPDLASVYESALVDDYDVRVAHDGEAALAAADETVDVVLLDRRMPGTSGDEVLDELRARGLDCRVVVVSAVDPDFDVAEMPFDDYLRKPVGAEDLRATVAQQLDLRDRPAPLDEFLTVQSKLMHLEVQKTRSELADSEEYASLSARADDLRAEVEAVADFEEVRESFEGLARASGPD